MTDHDTFTALYSQNSSGIYRFALHMSGSVHLAEEVTQQTFVMLIDSPQSYDPSKGPIGPFSLRRGAQPGETPPRTRSQAELSRRRDGACKRARSSRRSHAKGESAILARGHCRPSTQIPRSETSCATCRSSVTNRRLRPSNARWEQYARACIAPEPF